MIRSLQLAAVLLAVVLGLPARAQEVTRLSPSAVLSFRRDPIDDTDYSSIRIRASSGTGDELFLGCYGRYPDAHVNFSDNRDGSLFIFRFNTEKPDSFPQLPGTPMRVWGSGTVRLVTNPPTGIANVPDPAIPRFVRGLRAGGRVVVRRVSSRGFSDAYFDLTGVARGLPRLSCLNSPAREAPRVVGRPVASDDDYDTDPVPADSAAAASGLDALRSALNREILPYVLGTAYVNATGGVDSVSVISIDEDGEAQYRSYVSALHFEPARQQGRPVPARWTFEIYKAEYVPRP